MTLILLMTATALAVSTGMTAALKCQVTEVEGTEVVFDCGKTADKLKSGMLVKVKTEKSKQAVEGC